MRRILTLISSIGLVALAPASAWAGSVAADTASCTKFSDGTGGYCTGTLRAFRQSPNASDQVTFYVTPTGLATFQATLGGKSYACMFATAATVMQFVTAVTQTNGRFLVSWDATGGCSTSYYYQGSAYTNY